MFKIVRCPAKLDPFFETLKSCFHWEHFKYFRTMVLLIGFASGRRNISALYRQLDPVDQRHRTRFNNFVLLERWDPQAALSTKASELVALLHPKPGDRLRFIIDDTKKEKRGGKVKKAKQGQRWKGGKGSKGPSGRKQRNGKAMEAVGWIHDPVSGRKIRGHQYVSAVIEFNGFVVPFGVRLYAKKEVCPDLGIRFVKTTQLAADLISSLEVPEGVEVLVEFDSYYLCPVVVKACRRKGFHFVSTLKSNRNLFRAGRKLALHENRGKCLLTPNL